MKKIAILAVLAAAGAASADTLDINLAGWQTYAGYGNAANSSANIALPVGTQITGAEFIDLNYDSLGFSWLSEFTLSINDDQAAALFWDHQPSADDNPGNFTGSGVFANPGYLMSGPFTMATNNLFVTVYESFDDGGVGTQDAQVNSGILRITYTPVPTPGAVALLGLGGLVGLRRRR